jgi:hypothetical protein
MEAAHRFRGISVIQLNQSDHELAITAISRIEALRSEERFRERTTLPVPAQSLK